MGDVTRDALEALLRQCALIAAEIDRLQRARPVPPPPDAARETGEGDEQGGA